MSRDSQVYGKSKRFASRIVRLYGHLLNKGERVISSQVVRSGTSIGANIAEALYAASRRDFLNKITIAQKECAETLYWLDLLVDNGFIDGSSAKDILADCDEILRMLVATTKKLRTSTYDEVRESADDYDADFANPLTEGGEQS